MNFYELLNFYSNRINIILKKYIDNFLLKSQHKHLVHAMKYGLLSGGKRLRPFLTYVVGNMLNINIKILDIPAASLECIHAYSLIHDDLPVMDNDIVRRGRVTCHVKYGVDIALLAGNALQSLAFSILSDPSMQIINTSTRMSMISELANSSGLEGMCGGQALDVISKKQNINLKKLENIYFYKTGALIRSAVRLGVLCSNVQYPEVSLILDEYACAIGLAFQIKDDILDIHTDFNASNKKNNKLYSVTYPELVGLDAAKKKLSELYDYALTKLDDLEKKSYNIKILKELATFIVNCDQ